MDIRRIHLTFPINHFNQNGKRCLPSTKSLAGKMPSKLLLWSSRSSYLILRWKTFQVLCHVPMINVAVPIAPAGHKTAQNNPVSTQCQHVSTSSEYEPDDFHRFQFWVFSPSLSLQVYKTRSCNDNVIPSESEFRLTLQVLKKPAVVSKCKRTTQVQVWDYIRLGLNRWFF